MKAYKLILAIFLGLSNSIQIRVHEEGEPAKEQTLSVKSIMSNEKPEMSQEEFNKLFIREDGLNHILLSDVNKIVAGLQADYPELIKVDTIGTSWQGRPINLVTLDATHYFGK